MEGPKIYTEFYMDLDDAVQFMTDSWVESAMYCDYTVSTSRDAVRYLLSKNKELERQNAILLKGVDCLKEISDYWEYESVRRFFEELNNHKRSINE